MSRLSRRLRRTALAAALLAPLVLGACAAVARQTARSYAVAPGGMLAADHRLRAAVAAGRWSDALAQLNAPGRGGPDDALLRDLLAGTVAYHAGRWAESGAALDRAAALADDRFTRSASRGALALVTNDLALPYVPGENERLLVHHYALLGRLRAGDPDGAAVEARRLAFLLERHDADGHDPRETPTRALLRYLAGVAFEAAGEREDAAVAYRNAARLGAHVVDAGDDAAPGTGAVVVVVEQGFVAHRVAESLAIRVETDDDWELLAAGERREGAVRSRVASLLTGDAGLWAGELPRELRLGAAPDIARHGASADDEPRGPAAADASAGTPGWTPAPPRRARDDRASRPARETLRVAWPAYRRPTLAPHPAALTVPAGGIALAALAAGTGDGHLASLLLGAPPRVGALAAAASHAPTAPPAPVARFLASADLSDAVVADFGRDRAARLARLVVRAAARSVAAAQAGRRHRELGDLVAGLGRAVERADTRSWHLLPGRIAVARLRLPAGTHALTVDVGGVPVSIGAVTVPDGGLAVATARLP